MKRQVQKRMQLHRETLRELASPQLARVAAGATLPRTVCVQCPTNHTIACSLCHTC
jgi:hypothetical protein